MPRLTPHLPHAVAGAPAAGQRHTVRVDVRAALDEVLTSGAPAQQELAATLLYSELGNAKEREAALQLIEAFRNDPYLVRTEPDSELK
ncbi:MAG: hypothetical protein CMH41_06565 [Micrococcales bacterium]|nr:hypothetical protein [Micrococcales bacterium]